jgi:fucose-1-phosphate guanylyltransferase
MHAMHVLEQQYGWEVLRQKRILLIHAGGYSQRTPTTSCLGKIATSIPKGLRQKKVHTLRRLMSVTQREID